MWLSGRAFASHVKGPGFDPRHLQREMRCWCSGIMQDSHSCDPGSIPGQRIVFTPLCENGKHIYALTDGISCQCLGQVCVMTPPPPNPKHSPEQVEQSERGQRKTLHCCLSFYKQLLLNVHCIPANSALTTNQSAIRKIKALQPCSLCYA